MEDAAIVDLYWDRNEEAIKETENKYGTWLLKLADNILADTEDSREVVNDTYFEAWCTMPEKRPVHLGSYLSRITRNKAIDIIRSRNTRKRQGSAFTVSLSELEECIPDGSTTEEIVEGKLLEASVEEFLIKLSADDRAAFIGRYYYMDSVKDIAGYLGLSENRVRNRLFTIRKKLKAWLLQEGFVV